MGQGFLGDFEGEIGENGVIRKKVMGKKYR
jgi:hypothetical protein